MRIAIDTNILIYAQGVDDPQRQQIATQVLERVRDHDALLPVQVLGELFSVLVKRGYTRAQAKVVVAHWRGLCSTIETTSALFMQAVDLAVRHKLQIWDALVLDAAADASCSILLSEDLQNGFVWRGVTVCNPFLAKPHRLIADLVRP